MAMFGGYKTRQAQLDAMEKKATATKKTAAKKKTTAKKKEPQYVLDKKTGRYVQK
jgi:hypothetical protein